METAEVRLRALLRQAQAKAAQDKAGRERFQTYFDALFGAAARGESPAALQTAYRDGMRALRAFYDAQTPQAASGKAVDLTALLSDVTLCCDLLLGDGRVRFFPTHPLFVQADGRALLWAVLRLLAVALENGRPLTLYAFSAGGVAAASFVSPLTDGAFGEAAAALAKRTAQKLSGRLWRETGQGGTALHLLLPRCVPQENAFPGALDFANWLSDRISPVYAAFSELCAPPDFRKI